jgi:hypothetical protein
MVDPDSTTPPTEEQNHILNGILIADCVCYCCLMLVLWHNCYFYLYKQSKWNVLFMMVFYILSLCILTLRLTQDINYIKTNAHYDNNNGEIQGYLLGDQCDVTATYL